jgi:hypothetical protein
MDRTGFHIILRNKAENHGPNLKVTLLTPLVEEETMSFVMMSYADKQTNLTMMFLDTNLSTWRNRNLVYHNIRTKLLQDL